MSDNDIKPIQTWAIVEVKGFYKAAGLVTEESHFGTVMCRLDIPESNGNPARTEFIGGTSIHKLTPCTEEVARLVLARTAPAQIVPYALPRPQFGQHELLDQDD
jgi:hypothetical protein